MKATLGRPHSTARSLPHRSHAPVAGEAVVGTGSAAVGNLAHLLHERAADVLAFRFIADDSRVHELTYAQLDERARAVAAGIAAAAGDRRRPALLLYAPGVDYVAGLFGCFYAGVPAVPAFPPGPTERSMSRLLAIIADAEADLVLTTSDLATVVERWLTSSPARGRPRVVATDTLGTNHADLVTGTPNAAAVLQYTSGSTSIPRGVILSHQHLLANCADIVRGFEVHDGSSAALWLPPYHDMGLIGGILTPLIAGIPVTFMSPTSFLRRPMSWLHMVSRYRATITGAPNFAYELCLRRVRDPDFAGLDLSSLEVTFTGAEPIRPDTIRRFVERFAPAGFRAESFYPCYGLAEATLYVTGGKRLGGWRSVSVAREPLQRAGRARPAQHGAPARTLVGCGAPGPHTRLLIVDPATGGPVDDGQVAEIWVSSPGIADGYWKRAAESAATFRAQTAAGQGPFLRTGDLGFMLDGELFVAGRIKDLIVINGRNYHSADIEQVCEARGTGLRSNCGAAFSIEHDEDPAEQLVVVYEASAGLDSEQHQGVIEGIRRAVSSELSLPLHSVVLIAPRTIPKTSSGKVQRWLCRRQYLAGELHEIARWERPTSPDPEREETRP